MAAEILTATDGIISRLVWFSFDKRSFCDLMDPEIRLQENYFYVVFRQVFKVSTSEQNEQKSATHNAHEW